MRKIQRRALALWGAVLLAALALSGTFAWNSGSQTATNEARWEPTYPVVLEKYERAADGTPTTTLLPGADFLLFRADGTQIGGRYTTDGTGKIYLELPAGDYYFEEWNPAPDHGFDRDPAGNEIKRYPFTLPKPAAPAPDPADPDPVDPDPVDPENPDPVDPENPDPENPDPVDPEEPEDPLVVTVYDPRLTGDLTITKTVENRDGSPLTADQLAQEFTFTVTFADGGSYDYTVLDGAGTVQSTGNLPSGGTLKLRHGWRAVFEDLPAGVMYTVTEAPVDGYYVQGTGHTGHIYLAEQTAEFRNVYQRGLLEITKTVVNEDGSPLTAEQLAQEFPFTVTFSDGGSYDYTVLDGAGTVQGTGNLPSGGTLKLHHGQTALFETLPDGVSYTVTETPPDGYRVVNSRYAGMIVGGFTAHADFENRFGPEPDEPGSLEVEKRIQNPDGGEVTEEQGQLEFSFQVTFSDGGTYNYSILNADGSAAGAGSLASGGVIGLKHGQKAVFPALPRGVDYTVAEIDDLGYRPLLQKADGTVRGGVTAALVFVNVAPDPETGNLILLKTVEGATPAADAGKEFVFTVVFSDGGGYDYSVLDENGNVLRTAHLDSGGTLSLKRGQRAVFRGLPEGLGYTVTEADYIADGYHLSMTNGTGTIQVGEILAEAVNAYPLELVVGIKTWDLGGQTDVTLPPFIWVRLYQGNTLLERVKVTPNEFGHWIYSFNVPKYDANGDEIAYRVEEEPIDGFRPEYGQDNYNIVNRYIFDPKPTPTPTPIITPAPVPSRTPSPSPTAEPSPSPSGEPSPTPETTPSPTPSEEPSPTVEPTPSPVPVPDATPTPTPTPTPDPNIPTTGDERQFGLWLTLGLVGLAGLSGCIWYAAAHRYRGKRIQGAAGESEPDEKE